MKDPQFFSLEGVDIHDDAALEAFAHHVWQRFTQANPRQQRLEATLENLSTPDGHDGSPEAPESHAYKGDVRT